MKDNRKGIVREAAGILVVVVLLAMAGGCLVRNVYVGLAAFEAAEGGGSFFDDIERSLQAWTDSIFAKRPPPQPAAPAVPAAAPAAAGKRQTAAVKAEISQVRFFEAGKEIPAIKDRNYSGQFSRQARRVYCEVTYKNNSYKVADAKIAVAVQCYNAAGKPLGERKGFIKPRKEWATANFTVHWGADEPGFWRPGRYTVKISLEGEPAEEHAFRVN